MSRPGPGRRLPRGRIAWGAMALAVAASVTAAAGARPAAAQYVEPFARRPGVALPRSPGDGLEAWAERLGFPGTRADGSPARIERLGSRGMVVIPALFADSPEPHLSAADIQRSIFDGPSPRGTVGDFFSDQSGGLFTIEGEVVPWVRTGVTLVEAAGTDGTFGDRLRDYVREAVALADVDLDFGRFDNDGPDGVPNSGDDDGFVDGIAIHFLEVAGSCGGPGVWPHLGGLTGADGDRYATDDLRPDGTPVRIQVYIADSAVDCDGVEVQGPEVMAHEIGHLIGLPDYYRQAEGLQPWQRHWAVGCFDTMGAGSWGCGTGAKVTNFGPTGLSALSRSMLGWATLEPVGAATDATLTLEPLGEGFRAFQIPLTEDGVESLIVEYRPRVGYDEDLPAGGVLVYHLDQAGNTARWVPPELPPAYGYHLVEADGGADLRRVEREGGNRGEASDVFARNGAVDAILDDTEPSTRDHLGRPTRVRLSDIRVDGGVARFTVSTRVGFAVAERFHPHRFQGGRPVTFTSRFEGGTLPLEATLVEGTSLPDGMELDVQDDEVILVGLVTRPEPFHASIRVRDAEGLEVVEHVSAEVVDPSLQELDVVAALAGLSNATTAEERAYVDAAGNGNGELDVGDVRAFLARQGLLPGAPRE